MTELAVAGGEMFRALALHLKEAGDRELRKEMFAAINRPVKPLRKSIPASVGKYVPTGYVAPLTERMRVSVSQLTRRRDPGVLVRVRSRGKKDYRKVVDVNRGRLRHPLFGDRNNWYVTTVRPGFFSDPVNEAKDRVQEEMLDGLMVVLRKAGRTT